MKKYLLLALVGLTLSLTACDPSEMHRGNVIAKSTGLPDRDAWYLTIREGSSEYMFSVSQENYRVIHTGDTVYFEVSKQGAIWLESRVEESK